MNDDQKFLDAVLRFGQDFLTKHPDLARLIESARAGSTSPKEVVKEIWSLAASNKDFQSEVETALFDAFKLESSSTALVHSPDRQRILDLWGFTDEDLVFQPFEDRPNYKMLHPLFMGMIIEILQYDGDLPELRTGEIPEGGSPAVPVKTHTRNPVALGAMLRKASEEVSLELAAAQEDKQSKLERIIGVLPEEGQGVLGLIRQETDFGLSVLGYGPGKKADFREIDFPTAREISCLSFEEKQKFAHKALTSTQGRRSVSPVIADLVCTALSPLCTGGVSVSSHPLGAPFVEVEWALQIDGGVHERNPNFNFIDTAAQSLAVKLRRELHAQNGCDARYELVVTPINTISERRVGWRATLYPSS